MSSQYLPFLHQSCETRREMDDWLRAVQWHPACLLAGPLAPSPGPGQLWILVALVLTPSHLVCFLQNHSTADLT